MAQAPSLLFCGSPCIVGIARFHHQLKAINSASLGQHWAVKGSSTISVVGQPNIIDNVSFNMSWANSMLLVLHMCIEAGPTQGYW
jgi:hypothetical protein